MHDLKRFGEGRRPVSDQMSIKVMNRVWAYSNSRAGELLVLLAIADHADDQGLAWPGIDSLARKTRQSPRHVTRCLANLAMAGELEIQPQRGVHGTNRYQVLCFPKTDNLSLPSSICSGDIECQGDKGVPQMSPKPSEPSAVLTHTSCTKSVSDKANKWPSEEEVLKHAKAYPGNITSGIPPGAISEVWARNYWSWRTFDKEQWPRRWPDELYRRFEREWQQGGRAARGEFKKNPARGAVTGLSANVVAIQTSSRNRELAGKIRALEDEVHQDRSSNMPFDPKKLRHLKELRAELEAAQPSGEVGKHE